MNRTDINLVSENVLVPLFKVAYRYEKLRNLNDTDRSRFPGIDLADDTARTAFQVSATAASAKIEETLRLFNAHRLFERYNHLIFYVLTERQKTYSGRAFQKHVKRALPV